MVRILLGIIAALVLLFGVYFWISESRIGKLQKTMEANIAKVAEQDATIKAYSDRLNLVQDATKNYQVDLQDIQVQTHTVQTDFQKKNVPLTALTDSAKATQDVNDHFNSMFTQLNAVGRPPVVATTGAKK